MPYFKYQNSLLNSVLLFVSRHLNLSVIFFPVLNMKQCTYYPRYTERKSSEEKIPLSGFLAADANQYSEERKKKNCWDSKQHGRVLATRKRSKPEQKQRYFTMVVDKFQADYNL